MIKYNTLTIEEVTYKSLSTFSALSKAQALIKVLQAVSNFSGTCTQSA